MRGTWHPRSEVCKNCNYAVIEQKTQPRLRREDVAATLRVAPHRMWCTRRADPRGATATRRAAASARGERGSCREAWRRRRSKRRRIECGARGAPTREGRRRRDVLPPLLVAREARAVRRGGDAPGGAASNVVHAACRPARGDDDATCCCLCSRREARAVRRGGDAPGGAASVMHAARRPARGDDDAAPY